MPTDPNAPNSTILPTHTCFDDALEFFSLFFEPGHARAVVHTHRIVHGKLAGNDAGVPYAHAWVEHRADDFERVFGSRPRGGGAVWQAGYIDGGRVWWALDMLDFYEGYSVREVHVYTLQEAIDEIIRLGHNGPWDTELHALVAKQGEGGRILGRATCGQPHVILHSRARRA